MGNPAVSVVIPTRHPDDPSVLALAAHYSSLGAEVVLQGGSGGIALAKNRGAQNAHGAILVFSDDDALIRHREGHSWVRWFSSRVLAERWWIGSFSTTLQDPLTVGRCVDLNLGYQLRYWSTAIGPFTAVRAHVFHDVGGFDVGKAHEDTEFARRLFEAYGAPVPAPVNVRISEPFSSRKEIQARFERLIEGPTAPIERGAALTRPRLGSDSQDGLCSLSGKDRASPLVRGPGPYTA